VLHRRRHTGQPAVSQVTSGGPWQSLGLQCLQRDWLSANHIVFAGASDAGATVVDTGHVRHAPMTLALIDQALAGQPLRRIVNTHLHSDHCGGNAALQARHPGVSTWVPAPSLGAVHAWDAQLLSYAPTGQQCVRFRADGGLKHDQWLSLGPARWRVLSAPGHDPDAVILFEPQTRTLIAGDALWQDRLAIIFPELEDKPGFAVTRRTLDQIEALQPRWVVPGHGSPFEDVAGALASSRQRLTAFEREPLRHVRHAARALTMFHMMECRAQDHRLLSAWLEQTPLFMRMAGQLAGPMGPASWARGLLQGLVDEGLLVRLGDILELPSS
jgi:glyoxylase-like metal-dependent hydrolase (beta-lactamase superfamily II)